MTLRVLAVDDDSGFLVLCKRVLQRGSPRGFSVIEAPDASSAVDAYREDAIDCVLVDSQLTGMLGADRIERLRKTTKHSVPVNPLSAEDCDDTSAGVRSHKQTSFSSKRAVRKDRLLHLVQDVVNEHVLCRPPRHERASTAQSTDNAS